MTYPIDHNERQLALDPQGSFIVQAPAGSGKTELLVQRYLTLLAYANTPEEILAITFTRKAAAEMRQRILLALQNAETNLLAKRVLERDQQLHWQLLNNPQRLRIQTIDSLCNYLTQQMPLLSQLGMQTSVTEDASECYIAAAKALLRTLETEQTYVPALQQLLLHLDNDFAKAERLFISMLEKREQWLPHIIFDQDKLTQRKKLEQALVNVILDNLAACRQHFPDNLCDELLALTRYAANQLQAAAIVSPIADCNALAAVPPASLNAQPQWLGLANLLLTQDYTWRKRLETKLGFPSGKEHKPYKDRMMQLLEQLTAHEEWRQSLQDLLQSPAAHYSDEQWQLIENLVELLPVLVAELKLAFKDFGVVDFSEIAMAAQRALGDLEQPSELALRLDYQIQHILIDEFQDTSLSQLTLLERLTAGWQSNDGHTLFVVGDPMQSIYRFRKAEVSIFLRAQQQGIGAIKLQPIALRANFRAQANLVNQINSLFEQVFPKHQNFVTSAIGFHPSVATKAASVDKAIVVHHTNQPEAILEIMQTAWQRDPNQSIAILVRARTHLMEILPAIIQAGIPFQSTEIIKLDDYSIVQDLLALTRAMWHPADRIAWFAILRAPWCGLTLADLHAIARAQPERPLWEILLNISAIPNLSIDGQQRLQRCVSVLAKSLQQRERMTWRDWIFDTWITLGGPACIEKEEELLVAHAYFKLLDTVTKNKAQLDINLLSDKLSNVYAPSAAQADARLQIMTVHKAKGLEFDVVILPELERKLAHDEDQLLRWLERPRMQGENDLIFAPIKSLSVNSESINEYIREQEKRKSNYETIRLLYVAATRAKQQLHLLGTVYAEDKEEDVSPPVGSFLEILWPVLQNDFAQSRHVYTARTDSTEPAQVLTPRLIKRLSSGWQLPSTELVDVANAIGYLKESTAEMVAPQWETQMGTAIHKSLQLLSNSSWQNNSIDDWKVLEPQWRKVLLQLGVIQSLLPIGMDLIAQTLQRILNDPRGRWILTQHTEAQSEYALTAILDDEVKHFIIDRTFVFEEVRWIIDYKTAIPDAEVDLEEFLDEQQKYYKQQLYQYGRAIRLLDKRPIRLALYFPACGGWREWEFVEGMCDAEIVSLDSASSS